MMNREQFLAAMEEHIERTGETASRFGMRVLGDPGFVTDVRRGKQLVGIARPNVAKEKRRKRIIYAVITGVVLIGITVLLARLNQVSQTAGGKP